VPRDPFSEQLVADQPLGLCSEFQKFEQVGAVPAADLDDIESLH